MENQEGLIPKYQEKFSSILIYGPPGSGKGTLGKFLANAGSQYHLSSGDIFRSLPPYTPAGQLYYSYASKGMLLPDQEAIRIWKYYVDGLIATNAFLPDRQDLLLDGIPRTLAQVHLLENFIDVKHIIVLEVKNTKELAERLANRARLEGRIDDIDPKVIEKRIEIYKEESRQILSYFPKHLISVVNAEQRPLEVLRDVLVRLSHLLSGKKKKSS